MNSIIPPLDEPKPDIYLARALLEKDLYSIAMSALDHSFQAIGPT